MRLGIGPGYVKPAKHVENRRDRRLRQYQSGKRKDVVVIRERETRHCLACSPQKSLRLISSAPGSPGAPRSMLTKPGRGTRWLWLVPFGFRPRTSLLLVSLRIWLGRQRSFSLLTGWVPSCPSEPPGPT